MDAQMTAIAISGFGLIITILVGALLLWATEQIPGDSTLKGLARVVVIVVACLICLLWLVKIVQLLLPMLR